MTTATPSRGLARSAAMQTALQSLEAAIAAPGGVLIRGETGTERDEFARAIHLAIDGIQDSSVERLLIETFRGRASKRPFVAIDCASANDLERTLFGGVYVPGHSPEDGLDRIAEASRMYEALTGTLFIRQITEMPGRLQVRLARILRDGEVRVETASGKIVLTPATFRPIATIDAGVVEERLIPELRRRLARTTIEVPPLRLRREDMPALVKLLLADICGALRVPLKRPSAQAIALLAALPWRGNFQELRDLVRALVLRTPARLIRMTDVLANVRLDGGPTSFVSAGSLRQARERFEREYVASVLEQHQGRMAEAAKALGIQRTNLYRKVRQLAVERRRTPHNS